MTIGAERFKDAARRFASGVTIVTVARDGDTHGLTATSFASASLDPPLVLVALDKDSRTRTLVRDTGRFAVNILREDQERVAKAFSTSGDKNFEDLAHSFDDSGAPLLDDSIASMSCRTISITDAGDHEIFVAEVLDTVTRDGSPLLYYNRSYHPFGSR